MGTRARFLQRLQGAGVLLPVSITGYLLLKSTHPGLPGFSCPLRALTGIPCPTCFLTRATGAALRGDFGESLQLHAFGPVVAAGLLWWSVAAIRRRSPVPGWLRRRHLLAATAAVVAYWLLRMALTYGLGVEGFPGFPPG